MKNELGKKLQKIRESKILSKKIESLLSVLKDFPVSSLNELISASQEVKGFSDLNKITKEVSDKIEKLSGSEKEHAEIVKSILVILGELKDKEIEFKDTEILNTCEFLKGFLMAKHDKAQKVVIKDRPEWLKPFNDEGIRKTIGALGEFIISEIKQETLRVNADKYKDKAEAIAVRLVTPDGNSFYTAISGGSGSGSGGSGSGVDPVGLKDTGGTAINPAKEDGNLASVKTAVEAIQTAVEILDDWDESDRAKVNLIAGQVGISAGAGAVATNTPRMTLASDDPAVVVLQSIAVSGSGELTVIATDLDIRDLDSTQDSVHLANSTGTEISSRQNNADAISATNDLTLTTRGYLHLFNGTTWDRARGNTEGQFMQGNEAHDAVDSGNPIKIGGKATDYDPDTEDEQGQTEVAEDDRVETAHNLRGEQIEGVNSKYHLFDGTFPDTGLDGVYDNSPTSSTSESVECWNYRYATFGLDIDKANTPTDINLTVEISYDGSNWFKLMNGPLGSWVYDDVTVGSGISRAITFKICARFVRVNIACNGTDASNTFTVDNSFIYLHN